MLGKIEGRRRRGQQRMRGLEGITDSTDIKFEQALGDGEGQGGLACCSPWGHKELITTEQLNNNFYHPEQFSSGPQFAYGIQQQKHQQ